MLTQVYPATKTPCLQKFSFLIQTSKEKGPGGETEASLNGASLRKKKKKKGRVQAVSELLQASLTHSGSAGRFRVLRPAGGGAIPLEFSCSERSTCLVWSGSSERSSSNVVVPPPNHSAAPWEEREGETTGLERVLMKVGIKDRYSNISIYLWLPASVIKKLFIRS